MSSLKETDAREELVGLLKYKNIDDGDGIDVDGEEELHWETVQAIRTSPRKPRRKWPYLLALTIFIVSILVLFVTLLHPAHTEHLHIAARLRPEEDYILDSAWNFDAAPTTREYTWVIQGHELNPDGVWRPMVLINSTFPGPLIECNEDDEIVVNVHNNGVDATSVHWHGLYQNGTNWMDGTVGVTNCPIEPGKSFTYRFNVTGQTGTYYYHSHMSMQGSDGLVGPLVIHARDGKESSMKEVPYKQDRVVMLSDHYYDLSSELLKQYLAPGNENEEPVPPSALINGRNIRNCSDLPNRNCSSTSLSRALFDLSANTDTRLRIINVGAFAEFSLQIDEHDFKVTEVDGTDVHPQSIHRLNITPAQRYSIILTPPETNSKGLYWMRARMITHCFAYEEPELQEEVWSVVRYTDHDKATKSNKLRVELPQTSDWSQIIEVECRDLNTTLLSPVLPIAAPSTTDHFIFLRSSFQIRDWQSSRGYLNDSSFHTEPTNPILHTYLDTYKSTSGAPDGINAQSFDPLRQLVYQTTNISTITILIQNFDDGNHPFHLHGYKFFVLAQGHGYAPPDIQDTVDLANPLRRDTASVEAFGWLLIRFVADNAGAWAFHCHLGWHLEAGLGMVFVTRVEGMSGWNVEEGGMGRGLCGNDGG